MDLIISNGSLKTLSFQPKEKQRSYLHFVLTSRSITYFIILDKIDIKHIIQNQSNQHSGKNSKGSRINSFRDDDSFRIHQFSICSNKCINVNKPNRKNNINNTIQTSIRIYKRCYNQHWTVLKQCNSENSWIKICTYYCK